MSTGFTPQEIAFYKAILEKFPGEKIIKSEIEADVQCTAHDDRHPSLGVDLGRNGHGTQVLIHCRSQGCEFGEIIGAVGLTAKDLCFANGNGQHQKKVEVPGCTLEEYSAYKNLPVNFLTGDEVGLEETTYAGVPALYIPYPDETGEIVAERFRVALEKNGAGLDDRFRWKKGDKPTLYGRHRLDEAKAAGYILLVEGESDAHTLWYYGKPCVAVPGARNWNNAWGAFLEDIPKIYVFVEPDAAGEKLWEAVSNCPSLKGRVRRIAAE